MTRVNIENNLFEAVKIVQQLNGENEFIINGNTIPRDNYKNFDSLCEINVIAELEELLEVEIKDNDLFVDNEHKPISLNSVVDKLYLMFKDKESSNEKDKTK